MPVDVSGPRCRATTVRGVPGIMEKHQIRVRICEREVVPRGGAVFSLYHIDTL